MMPTCFPSTSTPCTKNSSQCIDKRFTFSRLGEEGGGKERGREGGRRW
jgi:hypothetical protein